MATFVPEAPASSSFASDLAGMVDFFISPSDAARRLQSKWFWIGPLIVISLISIITSSLMMPMVQHVLEVAPVPAGVDPLQYEHNMQIGLTIQRVIAYVSPVWIAALFAISAGILLAMCAMTALRANFRALFNLVAGCGLISMLAYVASTIIVKVKGDASTMAELKPPLGLDIFLPENANKFLTAFLGYFNIFELWWLVMMILIISVAFRTTKAKAFFVVLPLVVLDIAFRLLGGAFQR
jgi:hypothetical protein